MIIMERKQLNKVLFGLLGPMLLILMVAEAVGSDSDTTLLYQTSCTVNKDDLNFTSDSLGNVFVSWSNQYDSTRRDILLQGVDKNGNRLWPEEGLSVCRSIGDQYKIRMAPDEEGGVVLVWLDTRDSTKQYPQLYTQRMNRQGNPVWETNGIPVCDMALNPSSVVVYPSENGTLCFWKDERNGVSDIFAQVIGSDGRPQWNLEGVPVCVSSSGTGSFYVIDGHNNKWGLTWEDNRDSCVRVYASTIDSKGNNLWKFNGIPVSSVTATQTGARMAQGAQGDYFVSWKDERLNHLGDIYAQRMDSTGNVLWNSGGLTVCNSTNIQEDIGMAEDGWGGFYITWEDFRNFTVMPGEIPIGFWQRMDADGNPYWNENGIHSPTICTNIMKPDYKGGMLFSGVNDYSYGIGGYHTHTSAAIRYDRYHNVLSSAVIYTYGAELPMLPDLNTGFYVTQAYGNMIYLYHFKSNPTSISPTLWKELE